MVRIRFFIGLFLLTLATISNGQSWFTGRVVDIYSRKPIANANVTLLKNGVKTTTDQMGYFKFLAGDDDTDSLPICSLKPMGDKIIWISDHVIEMEVFNMTGQKTNLGGHSLNGNGEIDFGQMASGLYLAKITGPKFKLYYKIIKQGNNLFLQKYTGPDSPPDTLIFPDDSLEIKVSDYYSQKYRIQKNGFYYELLRKEYEDINYLNRLPRFEAFNLLQGEPLSASFAEVKTVKVVYSIIDDKIYYTNSLKYFAHFYFCNQVLGYTKGHEMFNYEQYTKNPNRIYILASVNHFTSSDTYTIDFFTGDELNCTDIEKVYNKVVATSFVGNKLLFFATSTDWLVCNNIPSVSTEELYKGQNYQALNPETNYGYLKKISVDDLPNTYLGKHDIVLLNSIPIDIPVVAGIITTEFQTPLSHINVLSHNRGTPNMALRDGWTNQQITGLLDKLVYLKVSPDTFLVREASLEEANTFWAKKEPQQTVYLKLDTITSGLIDLNNAGSSWVPTIGGKAANFSELTKVVVQDDEPLPIPEGYFAIPFYYYWQHMKKYGLNHFIDQMLSDPLFETNSTWRQQQLLALQDSIKKSPLDTALIQLVKKHLSDGSDFTTFRFRSSTNAEDVEGFNGAGLYDSYTGTLNDPDRPIDKAIKKVWASLWNYGAFEERSYFKIDHKTIAMGILVHRSYPAEAANGVAITMNLYSPYNPAITFNVQVGEISVVNPDDRYFPDQIIYYTYSSDVVYEYINHSNVPGMDGTTVLTEEELITLRNYCMAIIDHLKTSKPLDIEFKVDIVNGLRKIYIKQWRYY